MSEKYFLVLKTGDSEIRALQNIADVSEKLIPIIEFTRGRLSAKDKIGQISKRVEKIKTIFRGKDVILDLTTEESLSNPEIARLYLPNNGYANWVEFLVELKKTGGFRRIWPTLLADLGDENFEENLVSQVKNLSEEFESLVYRSSIKDDGYLEDIELILGSVRSGCHLICIIDCEFLVQGALTSVEKEVLKRLDEISHLDQKIQFVLTATSFPNTITDLTDDFRGRVPILELDLYRRVLGKMKIKELQYSDYGTINPKRNDTVVMRRGWIPRIDIPQRVHIDFIKTRKVPGGEYSDAYVEIAQEMKESGMIPQDLKDCWGIECIEIAARGLKPGASPSFWISVRMNIHINQQLKF